MIVPIILSGGSGSRLWPLSRETYPKQFLPLVDQYTMLQSTALRIAGLADVTAPLVVCNEEHRFMVAEQLRAVGVQPAAVILEPVGRNTAPAVAVVQFSCAPGTPAATSLVWIIWWASSTKALRPCSGAAPA